jgi:hypothetical protein
MRSRRIVWSVLGAACVLAAALPRPHAAATEGDAETAESAPSTAPSPSSEAPTGGNAQPAAAPGELSPAGRAARGIYVNSFAMRRMSARSLERDLRQLRMDAVVIDVKDSNGHVAIDTRVPALRAQSPMRRRIRNLGPKLAELKAAGVYTIARVVCFADNQLPRRRPDLAVRRQHSRAPWVSAGTGGTWLDPHNEENHAILLALALEVQALGFDEIQLDYVRFPVDDATRWAVFPSEGERSRVDSLVSLLRRLDAGLRIPLSVDVFGLAAYREGDPAGLGQDLVQWAEHVEVISPMLYLNAMRSWQVGNRNRAQNLVQNGVAALRGRVGEEVVIRPYLQAFSEGADEFNPRFIAAQIRGARSGGSDGFLFWNTTSRYVMLEQSARRIADLHPFPRALGQREP